MNSNDSSPKVEENGTLVSPLGYQYVPQGYVKSQQRKLCRAPHNLPIASKPITSDLKLLGAISEAKESKDPEQNANSLGAHKLDSSDLVYSSAPHTGIGHGYFTYINSLRVIAW